MGGLSLLLVLLLTPGGVGGGGGSLNVPVFPWDFHKTQPYQVSIRSKTHHLLHKLLLNSSYMYRLWVKYVCEEVPSSGPRLCTRILLCAMFGLLKIPL